MYNISFLTNISYKITKIYLKDFFPPLKRDKELLDHLYKLAFKVEQK
jgi:hypothetical protein